LFHIIYNGKFFVAVEFANIETLGKTSIDAMCQKQ